MQGGEQGSIATADIDGDGDQNVIISGSNASFTKITTLYTNDGAGNFTAVVGTPFEGVDGADIAFADVDNMNGLDVLITGLNQAIQKVAKVYRNATQHTKPIKKRIIIIYLPNNLKNKKV